MPCFVKRIGIFSLCLWALFGGGKVYAQLPTVLTDKIHHGSGTINLLRDITADQFRQYLTPDGSLLFGVDLNEDAGGNESRDSIGVAIRQMELIITTTAGTYSFSDFFTSTTASIREAGSATAQDYYTLFGRMGSSQITGASPDLGRLDDVVSLRDISFQGTILSASLNVTFLNAATSRTQGNETFFDWSDGFEDFALLGRTDAALLEAANFGIPEGSSTVSYTYVGPTISPPTPGAPAPPLVLLAAMGLVVIWRTRGHGKR